MWQELIFSFFQSLGEAEAKLKLNLRLWQTNHVGWSGKETESATKPVMDDCCYQWTKSCLSLSQSKLLFKIDSG